MNSRSPDRKVLLGTLGKPFGIKGFIYLHYHSGDLESLNEFNRLLLDEDLTLLKIKEVKIHNERVIILFNEINNRNAAELLRNKKVYVLERDLPKLESGTYYWYQLEGLTLVNEKNLNLGTINTIMATGANDVISVSPTSESIDQKERLIPYIKEKVVKKVDLKKGKLYVEWPEDY